MKALTVPLGNAAPPAPGAELDGVLSPAELFAVRRALVTEANPNHLVGFASSLTPGAPVAASLLFARSALLELRPRVRQDTLAADGAQAARALAALIDKAARTFKYPWSGELAIRWIAGKQLDAGQSLGDVVLSTAPTWTDVAKAFRKVSPPAVHWPPFDRMRAAAEGARCLQACSGAPGGGRGRRDLYEPALSLAQPMLSHAESAPLARQLQGLGFPDAYRLTRGKDVAARAMDFMNAVAVSQRMKLGIGVILLLRRRMELDQAARATGTAIDRAEDEVRRAASDMIVSPSTNVSDVPEEVANLARCLVVEVGPDIRVIDPMTARLVLRPRLLEPSEERDRWVRVHAQEAKSSPE